MTINPNTASLQYWGYVGRAYIKNNFTIVITQVTFEEQGREFLCELRETRFSAIIETKYKLELVLGK